MRAFLYECVRRLLRFAAVLVGVHLFVCVPLTGFPWSPFYAGMRKSPYARAKTALSQMVEFRMELEEYRRDNGCLPTTTQGLAALLKKPTVPPLPRQWRRYLVDVDYIPKDPWGTDYRYRSPGPKGEPYEIISYGADGKPGGKGLDADLRITEQR